MPPRAQAVVCHVGEHGAQLPNKYIVNWGGVDDDGWPHPRTVEFDRDWETLYLGDHGLGAAGAAALVPALQHAQCRLTELNLGSNGLGAAGAAALVPALQHAHCRLTVHGAARAGRGFRDRQP